jgi:hypothetical protein
VFIFVFINIVNFHLILYKYFFTAVSAWDNTIDIDEIRVIESKDLFYAREVIVCF